MVRIVAYSTPVRSVLGPKCAIRTPKHAPQTWATLGLRYAPCDMHRGGFEPTALRPRSRP